MLDGPPVWLLIDPKDGAVPIAENVELDTWSTVLWMVGMETASGAPSGAAWTEASRLLGSVYMAYATLDLLDTYARKRVPPNLADKQPVVDKFLRQELESLRWSLKGMSEAGMELPQLPAYVVERAAELGIELPGQEKAQ